jgi:iron(III) transport system substrate-binding protein
MFGFDNERYAGFPVKTVAPCEGTGYEVGGIALIKGARHLDAAQRYYDFLMSPEGQALGGQANSLQFPANKKTKLDNRIPNMDNVRLVRLRLCHIRCQQRTAALDRTVGPRGGVAGAVTTR